MAGIAVTKTQVDDMAGTTARDLRLAFERVADFKQWLDTKTAGDLENMGYTAGEAAVIKSAFADMAKLAAVFNGADTVTPAYDFKTFARQLWGLGVTNTSA